MSLLKDWGTDLIIPLNISKLIGIFHPIFYFLEKNKYCHLTYDFIYNTNIITTTKVIIFITVSHIKL